MPPGRAGSRFHVLPLFRDRILASEVASPTASGAPLESSDARPEVLLDPPMVSKQFPGGLPSGFRLASRAHIVLAAFAPAGLSLVVPEVEVLVPVDPTHAQTTTDPHLDPSFLPLYRGKSRVPMNLSSRSANPSHGPPLSDMIISAAPLYIATRLVRGHSMDRLQTHVEGFDEALGGGIPRGSIVLVAGTPGTMKTALTFSILYENVKAGSKALYISLEESQEDLRSAMSELGMTGLDAMELYILDIGKIRLEHKDEELSKNWLDVLRKYIEQRVRVNHFDLVAIDSLAALYSLSHLDHPRRDLFHFFGFLKSLGATCFLISEVPTGNNGKLSSFDEEFLADGILVLRHFEKGETDVQLRLRTVKMRRTRHEHGYYALSRNNGRFQLTRAISE